MRRLIPDNDPAKLMLRKERFDQDITVSVGTPVEVLEHLLQNAGDAAIAAAFSLAVHALLRVSELVALPLDYSWDS
mgnify:CR=1 FL=1